MPAAARMPVCRPARQHPASIAAFASEARPAVSPAVPMASVVMVGLGCHRSGAGTGPLQGGPPAGPVVPDPVRVAAPEPAWISALGPALGVVLPGLHTAAGGHVE